MTQTKAGKAMWPQSGENEVVENTLYSERKLIVLSCAFHFTMDRQKVVLKDS